jgi:hypothetical protein
MNQELLQKLMVAKKIMDVHSQKPRGGVNESGMRPSVTNYNPVPASYNIPQEYLAEQPQPKPQNQQLPTQDRIMNSRLPDEIKKLMLEHPIEQPKMSGTDAVLSDDLIEAASRLMNTDAAGKQIRPTTPRQSQVVNETSYDMSSLRTMLKEVVEEVLSEKGLVVESTQKTKEHISFRVGQHVFEGVVTKIKKLK